MRVYKEFLSRYSEEEIKNNPESIVQEFIIWERKNNPKIKAVREPMAIRNHYFIRYNKFEDLKEAYNESLREPFADEMAVRATYKKKFIDKGLKDPKAKRIYDNLKSGTKENILIRDDIDILSYYTRRLAVIELIKFEDFLNSRVQSETASAFEILYQLMADGKLYFEEAKTELDKKTLNWFYNGEFVKTQSELSRQIRKDLKVNFNFQPYFSDTINGGDKDLRDVEARSKIINKLRNSNNSEFFTKLISNSKSIT